MNSMFSWQEQYLTSERRSLVRSCSSHENIKFIFGGTISRKAKGGNRDVIERYDTHKDDIRKIGHSSPG